MRTGLFATLLVAVCLLTGSTCIPLLEETASLPETATTLGVTISSPETAATVPQGTVVDIRWATMNQTGRSATARLYVESRTDLAQTVLVDGLSIEGTSSRLTAWDTSGFAGGAYVIYADITTSSGAQSSATGPARVTIDLPPTFEFTAPTENTEFVDGDTLTIEWTGYDAEGDGRITLGFDPDTDHESGNEVFIGEAALPDGEDDTTTETTFDWEGNNLAGDAVDPGVYNLFALVEDDLNDEQSVNAGVRVTVVEPEEEEEEETLGLGIIQPEEETVFLPTDDDLVIEFSVNEFEDTIIDLELDGDNNHRSGNELTILSQRVVSGGTETDTFAWDGTLADGTPVSDGIYRPLIVMNTGDDVDIEEGPALILRRATEDKPLIGMLQPRQAMSGTVGNFVKIHWRDDDPTDSATIRITVDDDPTPAEGEPGDPDDMAELEIVSGREAPPDGDVQDSFQWRVPYTMEPGTYYVFGYIVVGGVDQHYAVAPGTLTIADPDAK